MAKRGDKAVDLDRENAELRRQLAESLAQQEAVAEVLQVINSSPGDLASVFDAMLEKAMHLCDAAFGLMWHFDGSYFDVAAWRGVGAEFVESLPKRFAPAPKGPLGRLLAGEPFVHIDDLHEAVADMPGARVSRMGADAGTRTLLAVPLNREGRVLGAFVIFRLDVRPFTDKQVALVQDFAAQAVIAMENARLITETRERTAELQEALEYQTATNDVLKAISRSAFELQPVLDTLIETAAVLCGAKAATGIAIRQGDVYRHVAMFSHDPEWVARVKGTTFVPDRSTIGGRVALDGQVVHVTDIAADPEYDMPEAVTIGGMRTLLGVPLLREGEPIGVLLAGREKVQPFTERQIELLRSFADQAVIAIENARLITETREALEQQTATAEVLQVINSSPGDLAPVFDAMLEKAIRLCESDFGILWTFDDECAVAAALHQVPAAYAELVREPFKPSPESGPARMMRGDGAFVVADLLEFPPYQAGDTLVRAMVDLARARSVVIAPLRKDGTTIGAITIYRQEVRPFTDKQIALLQNFAAQAVIAMENARLITETRQRTAELQESLEYQTATSDVLKIISRSPVDLGAVLDFVCDTAARLCQVTLSQIFLLGADGVYRWATGFGLEPAYREIEEKAAITPGGGTLVGRVALTGKTVHILDGMTDPRYEAKDELHFQKCHTLLGVPLLRDGVVIGVICLARREIQGYSEKQMEVVTTFADQAVIAMENARLFDELHARTDEIAGWNRELEGRVAAQVEELGRVGRLKRFLAPQLAELIVSQGDENILESHRREIVVVFCDLRGYTAFTETAEPEEVLDFLREYHGVLGPLVAQFEGTLDQFSGDGIMVFFNDPVPCPDPAERAVKMAVAMREAAGNLITGWRRRGRELGFGAGIAQGYATLGQIGFAERSGYTAIGTVCNLAARLCGEAKDGQILLSQRVAAALDGSVSLEEIGALTLKGLTQPVVAFNVAPGVARGGGSLRVIS